MTLEATTFLPLDIRLSGFWRIQSGNPWTPEQSGDLNGDGVRFNDRPFIFRPEDLPLFTTDPAEAAEQRARYAGYLEQFECVGDYVGRIIPRNTCRLPWFNRLDLRLARAFDTGAGRQLELQVDLFNFLNGLTRWRRGPFGIRGPFRHNKWGRYMGVFGANRNLVAPESFDPATNQILYTVPTTFGREELIGANLLLQFQVQLGLRYRF